MLRFTADRTTQIYVVSMCVVVATCVVTHCILRGHCRTSTISTRAKSLRLSAYASGANRQDHLLHATSSVSRHQTSFPYDTPGSWHRSYTAREFCASQSWRTTAVLADSIQAIRPVSTLRSRVTGDRRRFRLCSLTQLMITRIILVLRPLTTATPTPLPTLARQCCMIRYEVAPLGTAVRVILFSVLDILDHGITIPAIRTEWLHLQKHDTSRGIDLSASRVVVQRMHLQPDDTMTHGLRTSTDSFS